MGDVESAYEEAHRCPRCNEPGVLVNKKRSMSSAAMRGTMIELLECRNDRCPDYLPPQVVGTSTVIDAERYRWSIQVNPDGSIPPKGSGSTGPKAFQTVRESTMVAQRARDSLAFLAAQDEGRQGDAAEILHDMGGSL